MHKSIPRGSYDVARVHHNCHPPYWGINRRRTHWLREKFPRSARWLSDTHARVRDLEPFDVSNDVSVAVAARGAPRHGENGPNTDGTRDHDGYRLSGGGRDL